MRSHLLIGLLGAVCLACGDAAPEPALSGTAAIELRDLAGREVRLAQPARRVVSLIPASTETVLALGAADRLVARTDYDTQPELRALPSVGGGLTPSLEWLLSLEPDLVVAWPDGQSRAVVARLELSGIPVYGARLESVGAVRQMISDLGALLGAGAAAAALTAELDARIGEVERAVAGRDRPQVLYLISRDPPFIAGPGSFVDELITIAGATNVFADIAAPWPQVSLEEILRRQPDVIVLPREHAVGDPAAALRATAGWRELTAVREGRLHVVPGELFNRPGPRIWQSAAILARLLHPAAFADSVARRR